MFDRFYKLGIRVLDHFAKALYHEYPVHDEDGKIIGYESHGIRGGRVEFDLSVREQDELTSASNIPKNS